MTNQNCFECEGGTYEKIRDTFRVTTQDGETLDVPLVTRWRCTKCGDEILPPESSRYIEGWLAERDERFTPEMVDSFLDFHNTDQTNAAIALGFGIKTFNRWSKGTQQVSRSMGYYLRALQCFPEVFTWIKERRWREGNATTKERGYFAIADELDGDRFPSLARAVSSKRVALVRHRHSWNPALELCCSPRP
jgi:YgiT-type zinc finger domain-containing protein